MFRHLRGVPVVRAALALALLLAVASAFGLHPEPGNRAAPADSGAGISKLRPGLLPHECLACLAHGLALPSPPAVSLAVVASTEKTTPSLAPLPPDRLFGGPRSGRSPPALF
jgi:hypothetical protein